MKGGHEEGGREGGRKGKKGEVGRTDDGKRPPPRCHMGGGLKETRLAPRRRSLGRRKPILPFMPHLRLTAPPPSPRPFPHLLIRGAL